MSEETGSLSNKDLTTLIVDALCDAGIVTKEDFDRSVQVAAEEIKVRDDPLKLNELPEHHPTKLTQQVCRSKSSTYRLPHDFSNTGTMAVRMLISVTSSALEQLFAEPSRRPSWWSASTGGVAAALHAHPSAKPITSKTMHVAGNPDQVTPPGPPRPPAIPAATGNPAIGHSAVPTASRAAEVKGNSVAVRERGRLTPGDGFCLLSTIEPGFNDSPALIAGRGETSVLVSTASSSRRPFAEAGPCPLLSV
jgi:hypothetical protein